MFPWRCLILPAGLMTSVCHATSHPTELFTPDALPCGSLCMWHDMSLSHYVCFHVFFIFADYHLWLCIHLCHVYLQLHLMPLRNRSYWPRGHVSDPGDGAREDLRGPAGGIWFRFAWSPCIWAMMQHCREMMKYTLTIIVIVRMFFLLGASLLLRRLLLTCSGCYRVALLQPIFFGVLFNRVNRWTMQTSKASEALSNHFLFFK